jgi:ribonuclease R
MIRVSDLNDDYYVYDEKQHCLRGRSNGKKYEMGTELRVKIVRTDIEQRHIDLALAN